MEINNIEDMKNYLQEFVKAVYIKYNGITKEVAFTGMIVKKTVDILTSAEFVYKKNIITVQISLLRLLCDNCLAIESAIELGIPMVMNIIENNQRVNDVLIDEENYMTDGYLKRKVAEQYPGFDKLYRFASESVHFSSQAITSAFITDNDGKQKLSVKEGNPELKEELKSNQDSMITLSKIIIDMLKKVLK